MPAAPIPFASETFSNELPLAKPSAGITFQDAPPAGLPQAAVTFQDAPSAGLAAAGVTFQDLAAQTIGEQFITDSRGRNILTGGNDPISL